MRIPLIIITLTSAMLVTTVGFAQGRGEGGRGQETPQRGRPAASANRPRANQ